MKTSVNRLVSTLLAAALTIQPGGKRELRPIDAGTKSWGKERYEPPSGVDLIYGGTEGFLFYYISAGSLFAWEPEGRRAGCCWTGPRRS